MAMQRGTRHIGGIGSPPLHVPSGLILGGLAIALALGVAYTLASTRSDQSPVSSEPIAVPEVVSAWLIAAPVTRVNVSAAEVDSQEFILRQAGIAPFVETNAMASAAPPAIISAPGGTYERTATVPGHVDIGMAEVDTQAYILSEAGPALRTDLAPAAH